MLTILWNQGFLSATGGGSASTGDSNRPAANRKPDRLRERLLREDLEMLELATIVVNEL